MLKYSENTGNCYIRIRINCITNSNHGYIAYLYWSISSRMFYFQSPVSEVYVYSEAIFDAYQASILSTALGIIWIVIFISKISDYF